jgi:CBS domain containing-hemolysin-like protein
MDSGHSRYPVARGDLDNAIGQVLVKDLMAQEWRGLRIEVLDMDGRRVDKVLATVVETCGEA